MESTHIQCFSVSKPLKSNNMVKKGYKSEKTQQRMLKLERILLKCPTF